MLRFGYLFPIIGLLCPGVLSAGQIYGSVISGARGVPQAVINISCSGEITRGQTATDGSYRINVPQQGQCTFSLPQFQGGPEAVIFSNPNPALFSFELVRLANGNYQLLRR
jgi:hypothetical protein